MGICSKQAQTENCLTARHGSPSVDVSITMDSDRNSLSPLPWIDVRTRLFRRAGTARASRLIGDQRNPFQEILDVEVAHCPLHVCKIQPKLYSILDVDPDRAKLCALWVLLGATDWHIQWHNLSDHQVLVVAGALAALALRLAGAHLYPSS